MATFVQINIPIAYLVALVSLMQALAMLVAALPLMAILVYVEYRLLKFGITRWIMPTLSKGLIVLDWLACQG